MRRIFAILFLGLPVMLLFAASSPVKNYLQENRIEEAVGVCRQFEVMANFDSENLFPCTWAYLRSDRIDSAEKLIEKVKKSTAPEAQMIATYALIKRKKFDEAKKQISLLSNLFKSGLVSVNIQELNAELYEAQGQLETAAFIYKQVINEDPKRGRAHWGLARFYLGRNDINKAKNHLEETTRLWPKHLGSRFNLAVLAFQQQNLTEASRWLMECYRLDRSDVGVLEQLGLLFEKNGKISEAVKFWQRAIEINKDAPIAKEKLGGHVSEVVDSLIESKQYDKALKEIEGLSKYFKSQPKLLLKRGIIYQNQGKWDKAVPDLMAYVKAIPKDSNAHRELGICYVNLKLVDQAGASFTKAAELDPGNGMNFAWLAYAFEAKKRPAEAREAWKRAVDLLTDPVELEKAQKRLAYLDKKLGKKDKEKENEENSNESNEETFPPPEVAPKPRKGLGPGVQIPGAF